MSEGEAVCDSGVLTPRGGWGEKGWMVGVQMRSAVLRRTDWTASGALDWGFPRSAEGNRKDRRRLKREVVFTDPQQSNPLNRCPHPQ